HPQLRARARVPAGVLLHGGGAQRRPERQDRRSGTHRRRDGARARQGIPQAARLAAVKRPTFNFQGTTEQQRPFLKTAVAFEDLAVAAYKGQAPKLRSNAVLAAAVGIHSVEARHAAWMRELFGITPAVHAFDQPASRASINRIVASTRFIVSKPHMKAKK